MSIASRSNAVHRGTTVPALRVSSYRSSVAPGTFGPCVIVAFGHPRPGTPCVSRGTTVPTHRVGAPRYPGVHIGGESHRTVSQGPRVPRLRVRDPPRLPWQGHLSSLTDPSHPSPMFLLEEGWESPGGVWGFRCTQRRTCHTCLPVPRRSVQGHSTCVDVGLDPCQNPLGYIVSLSWFLQTEDPS